MNEFETKAQRTPSELELLLERLTNKNEDWSRLTGDLHVGLQKISYYTEETEAKETRPSPSMLKERELSLVERLQEQLNIQESHIQSLEFSLRHLRTIV